MGRAATELGLSPSAVSKRLSLLEARLGVVLMRRTTRRLSLTEAGETAFRWAQHLLAAASDMAQELAPGGALRGLLRVSASSGFGRNHVAPVLSDFAARHPEVEVRLEALDRPVDPAAEGIDVDIRIGGTREPHLHARRLAANRRVLCAAPAYLAAHGRPLRLADLTRHRCLVIRERDQPVGTWRLEGPEGVEAVRVRGSLSTNLGEMAHQWALDGHGIVLRSFWDVAENLRAGRLERVLPGHCQEADVWAVYPTGLSRLPKVEAFLGLLVAHLARLEA
ncbi:LysR family transcriptional regulator [Acetobacteraceae bacterium H6797]|nr:LysR family transcriptional regulator [Acetobacteraceae bacterium H6797]